jgi:hypothetical protein
MFVFFIDSFCSELFFCSEVLNAINLDKCEGHLREASFADLINDFIFFLKIDLYDIPGDHGGEVIFKGRVVEEKVRAFAIVGEQQHQLSALHSSPLCVDIIQSAVADEVSILFTLISENSTS